MKGLQQTLGTWGDKFGLRKLTVDPYFVGSMDRFLGEKWDDSEGVDLVLTDAQKKGSSELEALASDVNVFFPPTRMSKLFSSAKALFLITELSSSDTMNASNLLDLAVAIFNATHLEHANISDANVLTHLIEVTFKDKPDLIQTSVAALKKFTFSGFQGLKSAAEENKVREKGVPQFRILNPETGTVTHTSGARATYYPILKNASK